MNHKLFAALVVVLGVAAGWYALRGETGSDAGANAVGAAPADESKRIAELERSLAQLQNEIGRLRVENGRTSKGVAPNERLDVHASGPRLLMSPEDAEATNRGVADRMETRFAEFPPSGTAEAALASDVEQTITSDIPAAQGQVPEAHSVECRQGMCKIAARFRTEEEAMAWADILLAGVAKELPRTRLVAVKSPGGGYELLIYAVRPGYESLVNLRQGS